MKYSFFLVLAALVGAACSDDPTANSRTSNGGNPPPAPAPANSALSGRILVSGIGADRIVELRDDHSDVFRLLGNETIALANVDGGDVVVWGTWDANPGFVVSEFTITGMHGRPALDGVLQASADGYALRLNDGSIREVAGVTSEWAVYVGARVWVIGFEDGVEVLLGLIARPPSSRVGIRVDSDSN